MKRRFRKHIILPFYLVLVMGISFVVPAVSIDTYAYTGSFAEEDESVQDTPWYESIPDLLTAGEYEEGVVIAGIDMSRAKSPDDLGSATDAGKLSADNEELIYVDPEDAYAKQDFVSWLQQLKNRMFGEYDDQICITSIRRSDMTTARILELLASDDSIVFAEPNYIVDMGSLDGGQKTDGAVTDANSATDPSITADGAASNPNDAVDDTAGGSVLTETGSPDTTDVPDVTDSSDTTDAQATIGSPAGEFINRETNPSLAAIQWSSSPDATFRALGATDNYSINVPGWSDDSNMDHEITVAVLDCAVDFSNPDLRDRAYTFSPELMDKLGCDEHGFNSTWESRDGKLELYENSDHGSHVAGIIGAAWDGRGIKGVGSNVRIVSVQITAEDLKTSLVNVLRGMNFVKEANKNGAGIRITNNSWELGQTSRALDAAVTELGKNGVISVFCAGNSGEDLNGFTHIHGLMANNPYAVIVSSTDVSGNLADTSNYGDGIVTLGAPGVDIISCIQSQNAKYIPMMAENNAIYENFECGSTPLAIYQVDRETGEKVEGTDGAIVTSDEAMGFECSHVISVPVNDSFTYSKYGSRTCSFRIDFGKISNAFAGDSFGFAYGGSDAMEISSVSDNDNYYFLKSHAGSWNICEYTLTDDDFTEVNESSAGGTGGASDDAGNSSAETVRELSLTVSLVINDADGVYFDTIGIGREKNPYGIISGTSQASPAAAGAAAVIASRHFDELENMDAASAEKLAGLVRSSVRPIPSLACKVSTGGIIDLSADTGYTPSRLSPDITDVVVSGRNVTLAGDCFGSNAGTVTLRKYVAGKDSLEIGSEVTDWRDKCVTLSIGEDFEGIMEAELTASNGKTDTIVKFINKSSNLFEDDHYFGGGTGEPFTLDLSEPEVKGDHESSGVMIALGDNIYYMPVMTTVEELPAYRPLYCYDPAKDSWSACPDYPVWIAYASAAVFDGKLYVKGNLVETDDSGNIPFYDYINMEVDGEACVYSYTPGESSWKKCSAENVATTQTLFNTDSALLLAGSAFVGKIDEGGDWTDTNIQEYDPENGAGEVRCSFEGGLIYPIAQYAFGHICVCSSEFGPLYVLSGNLSETDVVEIDLPQDGEMAFSFAGNEDALFLVGPISDEGLTDTHILKAGQNTFSPYDKRVSDAMVFGPASVALNGRLYVIGSSDYEPDDRIFRSTFPGESESEPTPESKPSVTVTPAGTVKPTSAAPTRGASAAPTGTVKPISAAPTRGASVASTGTVKQVSAVPARGASGNTGVSNSAVKNESATSAAKTSNPSATKSASVSTGDDTDLVLWFTLLTAALVCIVVVLPFHRKRRKWSQ